MSQEKETSERRLELAQPRARPPVQIAVVGAVTAIAGVVFGREVEKHLVAVETWAEVQGPWAWLAFVGLFAVATSAFLPESVFGVIAGAIFGFSRGLAVMVVASQLAAAVQFGIARRLLRTRIERAIASQPKLADLRQAVIREPVRLPLLLRLTLLHPATINYLLAAAGARFMPYWIVGLAALPHLAFEVYLGQAGKHVARLAAAGVPGVKLHDVVLLGGLVVTLGVFAVVSKAARRAIGERATETRSGPPERTPFD